MIAPSSDLDCLTPDHVKAYEQQLQAGGHYEMYYDRELFLIHFGTGADAVLELLAFGPDITEMATAMNMQAAHLARVAQCILVDGYYLLCSCEEGEEYGALL